MQFTKEAQALARDSVEAIKFLAKKAGRECPKCKGRRTLAALLVPTPGFPTTRNWIDCPTCNGTGEISQQEMIRQAQESIAKKESGKYRLTYKKNTRTIVAEPREWEWKPEVGDFYYQDSGNRRLLLVSNENEAEDIVQRNLIKRFALIPLLCCERIEEILTNLDYELIIVGTDYYADFACGIQRGDKEIIKSVAAPTRREAVVMAVIELAKKKRGLK